jgi:DNA replication and repair protein RecF
MSIARVNITDLRNLSNVGLSLGPAFNFFFGDNGAGKTSLLEALYLIHSGRSFRTADLTKVIMSAKERFYVFVETQVEAERSVKLGLSREAKGGFQARVDGVTVPTLAELAAHLPLQIISPESLGLLTGGNKERRKFVDWGVFHVEHNFHDVWRRSQRLLAQRNKLLKLRSSITEFQVWDSEFVAASEQLTCLREAYLSELLPYFSGLAHVFFPQFEVKLNLQQGWTQRESLAAVLQREFEKDLKYGYTQSGAHRAGFQLKVNGQAAEVVCSRGQLKLLVCCLKLAQAKLLSEKRKQTAVFLIDDIESELDGFNRQKVLEQLRQLGCQALITLINIDAVTTLLGSEDKVFHVEHGCVSHWQSADGDRAVNNKN